MKIVPLSIAALIALSTASLAADGSSYEQRGEDAVRGKLVVSDGPRMMTAWDYFFNNPEKYRSMRNDPGEYHVGGMRR